MLRFSGFMTTLLVFCSTAGGLRADAVLLRNGERIECRILGGSGTQIHIRRPDGNGGSYMQIVDRADIARLERDPATSQPAAATQPAAPLPPVRKATSAPAAAMSVDDLTAETKRSLIVAIARWRAEDFTGAGMDLSRLINTAKPGEREAISSMALNLTQKTLAELAADTHLKAAMSGRRGAAVRLPYVTEYEKQALIPMLVAAYDRTLRERNDTASLDAPAAPSANAEPRPASAPSHASGSATQPWYAAYAQSRPAEVTEMVQPGDSPAIIDWLDRPTQFKGTVEQARTLVSRVHQATSLLNERLRLDPALRRNTDLKRKLLADKQRLVAMGKALTAYSPEENEEADEAATAEAEKTRREEYEKRMQEAREQEVKRIQEAREAARKWQEEQEQKKGVSWFDWLKPAEQNQPAQPAPAAKPVENPK